MGIISCVVMWDIAERLTLGIIWGLNIMRHSVEALIWCLIWSFGVLISCLIWGVGVVITSCFVLVMWGFREELISKG